MNYTFSQLKEISNYYNYSNYYDFGFRDQARKFGGFVKRKALPIALAGAMASGIAHADEPGFIRKAANWVGDKGKQAVEWTKDAGSYIADQAKDGYDAVVDKGKEVIQDVKDSKFGQEVGKAAGDVKYYAGKVGEGFDKLNANIEANKQAKAAEAQAEQQKVRDHYRQANQKDYEKSRAANAEAAAKVRAAEAKRKAALVRANRNTPKGINDPRNGDN